MVNQTVWVRKARSDLYYDTGGGEWVILCSTCISLVGYAPTKKIARRARLKHTRAECLGGY